MTIFRSFLTTWKKRKGKDQKKIKDINVINQCEKLQEKKEKDLN